MENLICLVLNVTRTKLEIVSAALKYDVESQSRDGFASRPALWQFSLNVGVKAGVQDKQWLPLMMSSQSVLCGRLKTQWQSVSEGDF